MIKKTLIHAGAVLAALLLFAPGVLAQTATTSTTLNGAITDTASNVIVLTATTDVEAGGLLFVDTEAMDVVSVQSTSVRVRRGMQGTRAALHVTLSLVYVASKAQKAYVFQSNQARAGVCSRTGQAYLPQIELPAGIVWDCPVGALLWAPVSLPGLNTVRSESFDIDNGAGTTVDRLLIRHPRPIQITACRIVYDDATTGTVAAGNAKVGTTVGGAEIVAATSYENTKAVGVTTAMVIVDGKVAAGTPVLVRHTGIAATAAGRAVVECDYLVR